MSSNLGRLRLRLEWFHFETILVNKNRDDMWLVIDFFIADLSVHGINYVDTPDLGDTSYSFLPCLTILPFPEKGKNTIQNSKTRVYSFWTSYSMPPFPALFLVRGITSGYTVLTFPVQGHHPKWPDMCPLLLEKLFNAPLLGHFRWHRFDVSRATKGHHPKWPVFLFLFFLGQSQATILTFEINQKSMRPINILNGPINSQDFNIFWTRANQMPGI